MQPRITKYLELTENRHPRWNELQQVRSIKRFPNRRSWVREGTLGGWVSSGANLEDEAWIGEDVLILNENVRVKDGATIDGNVNLWGSVEVSGDTYIHGTGDGIQLRQSVKVLDHAEINGSVRMGGRSIVRDHALVVGQGTMGLNVLSSLFDGFARVQGRGNIHDSTFEGGDYRGAFELSSARLAQSDHLLTVGPVGSENVTARLYRTGDDTHTLSIGCWAGSVEELDEEVRKRSTRWTVEDAKKELWKKKYALLKQMCEMTIEGWKA